MHVHCSPPQKSKTWYEQQQYPLPLYLHPHMLHPPTDLCTEEGTAAASTLHKSAACKQQREREREREREKERERKWLTRHKLPSSETSRKSRLWSSRADPIPDLRQLRVLAGGGGGGGLEQTLVMLGCNYWSYLTLFKVELAVSFHSIWPLDADGGSWNHNSVIASLCPRFNFL